MTSLEGSPKDFAPGKIFGEEKIAPRQRVRVSIVPQRIEEGWSDLVLQLVDKCLADLVPQMAIGAILQPAICSLVFDFFM